MTFIKVPAALKARNVNAYSDSGEASKTAFHKEGKAFLKKLAAQITPIGAYSIRSNMGGIAVSGEVTLHSEDLYVQLSESCMAPGIQMMYRSCDSSKDCCGHTNNFVQMSVFVEQNVQSRVLSTMWRLIEAEQLRKKEKTTARASVAA